MKKSCLLLLSIFFALEANAQFTPSLRLTYEAGIDSQKNTSFGLDLMGDFKVSPLFSIGAGTGIYYSDFYFQPDHYIGSHYYDPYYETGAYVPLFANIKINFVPNGVSPYLLLNPGYSILVPFSDYARDYIKLGAMFSAMAGIDVPMSGGHAFFVEVGYKYQKMSSNSILYTGDLSFNQLRLSLGYSF